MLTFSVHLTLNTIDVKATRALNVGVTILDTQAIPDANIADEQLHASALHSPVYLNTAFAKRRSTRLLLRMLTVNPTIVY